MKKINDSKFLIVISFQKSTLVLQLKVSSYVQYKNAAALDQQDFLLTRVRRVRFIVESEALDWLVVFASNHKNHRYLFGLLISFRTLDGYSWERKLDGCDEVEGAARTARQSHFLAYVFLKGLNYLFL